MRPLKSLWVLGAVGSLALSAHAQVLYTTSWEPPDFTAGSSAVGTQGWTAGSGTGSSQTISAEQARTGSQSLKWDNSGTLSLFYSIRRDLNWGAGNDLLIVTTYVWISASTQANRLYGLYLSTGTLSSTVLGITISGNGTVRAGTSWSATYSGAGIGQAPAGQYTERWIKLELTYDRSSGQGTAKAEDPGNWSVSATFSQSTTPTNVNLGTDYVTTADRAGVAYFDDLEIRAEPAPPFDGWDETDNGGGDAGDLPGTAQKITASDAEPCHTPVARVRGLMGANDADLYVICITNPAQFSASTIGTTGFDTQLWLFDCAGKGVVHNDDDPDATTGLQSRIDNRTNCITQPGIYLLGITRYNRYPIDDRGQPIWAPGTSATFRQVRCPDGVSQSKVLAGWSGTSVEAGRYIIELQGAHFVDANGTSGGDINGDGCVDDADLLAVLFAFGETGPRAEDLNCDGVVDDADLLTVLFHFGNGC